MCTAILKMDLSLMHMLRRSAFAFLLAVSSAPAVADFSFGRSDEAMVGLGKAYGYLLGQDYTLKRIATLYPALQAPVKGAEHGFAAAYGSSIKDTLATEISAVVGSEAFGQIATRMESSVVQQINTAHLTQDQAVKFIAEVNSRAKGEVDASVRPFLLAARYKDQPAREFSAKQRQRFDTQGHPKSLGLNLTLDVPVSWVGAEGERPHIVQKWQSMAGFGQQMITLDIRNTGAKVTPQEIKAQVDGEGIKSLTPPDSTFINGGAQTVETLPGYWLDFSGEFERAGVKIYQVARLNAFFIGEQAFLVSCATTVGLADKAQADKDFVKLQALCPLVVNSIVVKDRW